MRGFRIAAIICSLHVFGCGGEAPPAHTVSLRVRGAGTPNASVTIDDQLIGPLASVRARGVALPPGRHTVSVEYPGFFPSDQIVVAPADAAARPIFIDVTLVPIPD